MRELHFGEGGRKRRVRTEEFRSELPPAGGKTRHRAMGRFRATSGRLASVLKRK